MIRPMRWWWWVALVLAGTTLAGMAASFVWMFAWVDSGYRYYVYLQHGMICGNPSLAYEAWVFLPSIDYLAPLGWSVKLPMHFLLVPLVVIVAYPLLPFAIRRDRRKRGLCIRCGYDLTGNVSGACPECGENL